MPLAWRPSLQQVSKWARTSSRSSVAALQAEDADESAYQGALRFLSLRTAFRGRDAHTSAQTQDPRGRAGADAGAAARAPARGRRQLRPRLGRESQHFPAAKSSCAWPGSCSARASPRSDSETALSEIDEHALAYQAGLKKARQLSTAAWQDFRRESLCIPFPAWLPE